jgi:hypothetical protein
MSWSIRITILYLGFVGLILTLVMMSMNQKVDLVSKDYYKQELNYQSRINAIQNADGAGGNLVLTQEKSKITIEFPPSLAGKITGGEITFFRPSDSSQDKKFNLQVTADGKEEIKTSQLQKGFYKIMISAFADGKEFYFEESITVK